MASADVHLRGHRPSISRGYWGRLHVRFSMCGHYVTFLYTAIHTWFMSDFVNTGHMSCHWLPSLDALTLFIDVCRHYVIHNVDVLLFFKTRFTF